MRIEHQDYPTQLFLAVAEDGRLHWYSRDPMKVEKKEDYEVKLAAELNKYFGGGSIVNPIHIAISGAKVNRAEPFRISQPGDIRSGKIQAHFEDGAGRLVEILQFAGSDNAFPLNGVIFSRKGENIGMATYSPLGECSDKDPQHALLCFAGTMESVIAADKPATGK